MHALDHIQHGLRTRYKVSIANNVRAAASELHVELHNAADNADQPLRQEGEVYPLQKGQRVVVLGAVVVRDGDQGLRVGALRRSELEVEPELYGRKEKKKKSYERKCANVTRFHTPTLGKKRLAWTN